MLQEGKKNYLQFKNKFFPLNRVSVKKMIIYSNFIILRPDKARFKH